MAKIVSPPAVLVDALGAAWAIYGLYPDPEAQPAFRRALEIITTAVVESVTLEVGPGSFLFEGEELEVHREGSDRLARRCYLHNLELVRVMVGTTERDLVRLFSVLAESDAVVAEAGGVEAALLRAGVEKVAVVQRALLRKAGEEEPAPNRDPEVEQLLAEAADPRGFAAAIVQEAGGDPELAARMFEELYLDIRGRVADDDVEGRERVVQAFVESFFFFPEEPQAVFFRRLVERRDHEPFQQFLDQFAGHELVRLAPKLDPDGFAALLDYARVASDQADRRPEELLGLLQTPDALDSARAVVAGKIGERLGELANARSVSSAALERIETQRPDSRRYFYDALDVFRGLLHVEERDPKFARLLRIWTGKVSAAIRRAEFRRAELWLRSAIDAPTYSAARRSGVENALDHLAESDALNQVLAAAGSDPSGSAVRILRAFGNRALGRLVQMLGEAEEGTQRRVLLDVLAQVSAPDPTPILERLNDSRWFVVRNLTIVLGRTGNPATLPGLAKAFEHPDHRVRVEALRAIAAFHPPDLGSYLEQALADPQEGVQMAAIGFLGNQQGVEADRALIDALEAKSTRLDARLRIIKALSKRPAAQAALGRLAHRRLLFSASGRQLRDAAREAVR